MLLFWVVLSRVTLGLISTLKASLYACWSDTNAFRSSSLKGMPDIHFLKPAPSSHLSFLISLPLCFLSSDGIWESSIGRGKKYISLLYRKRELTRKGGCCLNLLTNSVTFS